jgi:hypothetical protein
MKKALFIFMIFAMTLQIAFAQRGRIVTVYLHNGSVLKGEISKLPNEERFKIQTPNGSVILFTSNAVRDILYEDGTRPGGAGNQPQVQPQGANRGYPLQNQPYPPQNQPNQAFRPNQPDPNQPAGAQSQNNRPLRAEPEPEEELMEEEAYDDDEFYDDSELDMDMDLGLDMDLGEETKKPSKTPAQAAPAYATHPSDFVPGYHGFIDFGYVIGMGDSLHTFNRIEATITQGYQFTPAIFAGLGAGAHLYSDSVPLRRVVNNKELSSALSYVFPLFVDFRYNFSTGRIRPFAGLKTGYGIGLLKTVSTEIKEEGGSVNRIEYKAEALGLYLAPSVGVKFMIGRSLAFNLSAGYSVQFYSDNFYKKEADGSTPVVPAVIVKQTANMGGLSLRAGLEF